MRASARIVIVALLLVASLFPAQGWGEVLMLKPSSTASSRSLYGTVRSRLAQSGTEPREVGAGEISKALTEDGRGRVLLLTDGRYFPEESRSALEGFLARGNHLVCMTGPAFSRMLFRVGDRWMTLSESRETIDPREMTSLIDFSRARRDDWERVSDSMERPVQWGFERVDGVWALHCRIAKLHVWDSIICRSGVLSVPEGCGRIVFRARGGAGVGKMLVEIRERDGSRWVGSVPMGPSWRRYVMTPDDFDYYEGGKARGAKGDALRLSDSDRISFGFVAGQTTATSYPSVEYWVSSIFAAKPSSVDAMGAERQASPVLESLSPLYKLQRIHPARLVERATGLAYPAPSEVISTNPRPRGFTFAELQQRRLIPVVDALSAKGESLGYAAHMMLNNRGRYAGSIWGYVGLGQRQMERDADAWASVVTRMVQRMQGGVFIANGGAEHYAYASGERPRLGCFAANWGDKTVNATIRLDVERNGTVRYRTSMDTSLAPGAPPLLVAGPNTVLAPGEYTVRVRIIVGGKAVDSLSHPVQVIRYSAPDLRSRVIVKNGRFYLNGRPWSAMGVNYWPRLYAGEEAEDYYDRSFCADQYDPEMAEHDLRLARSLGVTFVSIRYQTEAQTRCIMDFLKRAETNGIKVNLYIVSWEPLCVGWDPMLHDRERTKRLMRLAHLAESPAMFAYDLAWEVRCGRYGERRQSDKEWNAWVADQYGSADSAIQDWGYTPPTVDGYVTGPTDEQVSKDGPWRVFVAAYRRFWDDEVSRRYREIREDLRSVDPYHLIGARSGFGGTGAPWVTDYMPLDLRSGAKHLDFITPEAYNLMVTDTQRDFLRGGFNTAYARFVSGGKPVVWGEYGIQVMTCPAKRWTIEPPAHMLEEQRSYFARMLNMVSVSQADGSAAWWWPGGYRIEEKSDCGVVNPDGTLRPAAVELRRAAGARVPSVQAPNYYLTVDRDLYASGYAGVYAAFSPRYVDAVCAGRRPGVRTLGTGSTSANVSLVAVGNRPHNRHNPPKYLNSEFDRVEVNGVSVTQGCTVELKRGSRVVVSASVGNTGEAKWLRSTPSGIGRVGLMARSSSGEAFSAIDCDTPFLSDAAVRRLSLGSADSATSYELRMRAQGRAEFGEVFRFTVKPQ